jgi:hypothetical protein
VGMRKVAQVLRASTHKAAASKKRFEEFALPDGIPLMPRHHDTQVKRAFAARSPVAAPVPMVQAQQTFCLRGRRSPVRASVPQGSTHPEMLPRRPAASVRRGSMYPAPTPPQRPCRARRYERH